MYIGLNTENMHVYCKSASTLFHHALWRAMPPEMRNDSWYRDAWCIYIYIDMHICIYNIYIYIHTHIYIQEHQVPSYTSQLAPIVHFCPYILPHTLRGWTGHCVHSIQSSIDPRNSRILLAECHHFYQTKELLFEVTSVHGFQTVNDRDESHLERVMFDQIIKSSYIYQGLLCRTMLYPWDFRNGETTETLKPFINIFAMELDSLANINPCLFRIHPRDPGKMLSKSHTHSKWKVKFYPRWIQNKNLQFQTSPFFKKDISPSDKECWISDVPIATSNCVSWRS